MLQEGGLAPGIKPLEALRLFASFYDDADDPERLLGALGLEDARHTYVRRLSGGQRQRLALAIALIGRPRVVFSTNRPGMNPHARDAWERSQVAQRRLTVVLTFLAWTNRQCATACDRRPRAPGGLGTPTELWRGRRGRDGFSCAEARWRSSPRPSDSRPARSWGARGVPDRGGGDPSWSPTSPSGLRRRDPLGGQAGRRSLEEVFLRLRRAAVVNRARAVLRADRQCCSHCGEERACSSPS
jgi:hypothetical protein